MTPDTLIELSVWQIALASSLVVVSAGISVALRLGLHRRLLWASVRCVVQLVLLGLVLQWVFAPGRQWYVVVSLGLAMTLVAGTMAVHRNQRRYAGMLVDSVISIWACCWLVAAVGLLVVVQPEPWYSPRYAIPLLGMILHSGLNGVSLGLARFTREIQDRRTEIETLLALGATRAEATREPIQEAIRTGMIPIINSMMVMGIVTLPGMMTGQLLAGVDPMQAIGYQIVIVFLLAAASALATSGAVLLGYWRLTSADHQLLSRQKAVGKGQ